MASSRAGPGRLDARPDDFWLDLRKRLMAMPQMRAGGTGVPSRAFGRRPADRRPRASVPASGSGQLAGRTPVFSNGLPRIGLPIRMAAPDGHDWFIAGALLAFFALGWLAAMAAVA